MKKIVSLFYRATISVLLHLPSIFREERQGKTKEKEEGFGFRIQEKAHAATTAPRHSRLENIPDNYFRISIFPARPVLPVGRQAGGRI